MTKGNELVKGSKTPAPLATFEWTQEKVDLLRRTLADGATGDEFDLFLIQCKRTQLDPFSRQMVFAKIQGRASHITTIDGFRLIAQRTGKYQGQTPTEWCGKDGKWVDVWLEDYPPHAAKVGIYHADFKEALVATANFDSYKSLKKDGSLNYAWKNMSEIMIAKCAEALGLRKAFPQELSGLYTADEMEQAENPPQKIPPKKPATKKKSTPKNTPPDDVIDVESETIPPDAPPPQDEDAPSSGIPVPLSDLHFSCWACGSKLKFKAKGKRGATFYCPDWQDASKGRHRTIAGEDKIIEAYKKEEKESKDGNPFDEV